MENNGELKIILASASPRRREILSSLGVHFDVICADADESSDICDPIALTEHLARIKGEAVLEKLKEHGDDTGTVVISADTVVACEGRILGKPRTHADAVEMLSLLSGREHTVATGVAVTYEGKTYTDCNVTSVYVDDIPKDQLLKYIDSGEPFDKAGGYGIQGTFSKWIRGIDGCYFGVVGLPVNTLFSLFYKVVGRYPDEI